MPRRYVVHVVDDDPAVRDSISELLTAAGYHNRIYASAEELLGPDGVTAPGCVLTDVCMPGVDGVALLQRLRNSHPEMPVVLITARADVPLAVRAMKAGAVDFLEKPIGDAELIGAVDAALGQVYRSREEAGVAELGRRRLALLTQREREVLEHVVNGASNKEVAVRIAVSPRTVEFHRARIMEKTGARSLPDLVRLWLAARTIGELPPQAAAEPGVGRPHTKDGAGPA